MSLSHYSSLVTLELDWSFTGFGDAAGSRHYYDHIDILEYISPTLQRLVFRFNFKALREWVKYITQGPAANGLTLETRLISLPDLKSLTITAWVVYVTKGAYERVVYGDVPVDDYHRTQIQKTLPMLSKAGRLQFNSGNNVTLEDITM